jgi:hypothetical protein
LAALPEATTARNVVLPETTIRLLVRAAREQSAEFGLLVETLTLTGARVSQLARCQIRDLAGERLMIPSSAKGTNKHASHTPAPIPMALADRLLLAAQGRPQSDPLLVRPGCGLAPQRPRPPLRPRRYGDRRKPGDGFELRAETYPYHRSAFSRPAGAARRQTPRYISLANRKHYAATIASHTDELVRASMIEMDRPAAEVVPIRRA